jgi:hypothetical protein
MQGYLAAVPARRRHLACRRGGFRRRHWHLLDAVGHFQLVVGDKILKANGTGGAHIGGPEALDLQPINPNIDTEVRCIVLRSQRFTWT